MNTIPCPSMLVVLALVLGGHMLLGMSVNHRARSTAGRPCESFSILRKFTGGRTMSGEMVRIHPLEREVIVTQCVQERSQCRSMSREIPTMCVTEAHPIRLQVQRASDTSEWFEAPVMVNDACACYMNVTDVLVHTRQQSFVF